LSFASLMLPQRGSFWFLYSTFFVISTADQIVRLERTPYSTWEPYFNPQIVNANVGELITFVANFSDQSFKSTYLPFVWAFAESDYSRPCIYNQGVFSGYFYIDPQGSANESFFSMPVVDSKPHFLYMVTPQYIYPCSTLAIWSTYWGYDSNSDIIFALNPNESQTLSGFKSQASLSQVSLTYSYAPRGGQLSERNAIFNGTQTAGNDTIIVHSQCPQSTGLYSNGSLAGAIIASLFGGLVLGIASMWIMNIKAVQQFSQKAHGGWLVWKNGGRSEILD